MRLFSGVLLVVTASLAAAGQVQLQEDNGSLGVHVGAGGLFSVKCPPASGSTQCFGPDVEDDNGVCKPKVSALQQTVDTLSSRVTDAQNTADKAWSAVDGAVAALANFTDMRLKGTETTVAQLQQTLSDVASKTWVQQKIDDLQNTYATKADLQAVVDDTSKLDGLSNTQAKLVDTVNELRANLSKVEMRLQAALDCNQNRQFYSAKDDMCLEVTFQSCSEIKAEFGSSVTSGVFTITPSAAIGPMEVYCDHETDGGGWTLVGSWGAESGYSMQNYRTGKRENVVKSSASTPISGGPAHYSETVMQALFHQVTGNSPGIGQYMSLTGQHPGGYMLAIFSFNLPLNLDVFRGVYDTKYSLSMPHTVKFTSSGTNTNPLPSKSLSFQAASSSPRTCSGSDCYHYLPDDLDGGGEWLFRENIDDTPTTAYTSGNVPSILFIR